ncbi:MAG TPA: FkbM family methyltransferase [Patescibacteria group bacterium]|nr:FkbM family methyltransferase [Patescibacteria group bacterium]
MNKSKFLRSAIVSKKPLLAQILLNPVVSFVYFVISRSARLLSVPVYKKAKTFWGQSMEGIITDPNFSFIYLFGFSDEGLTQMIMKYLKTGMTFVDIGAHIGYETLLSSKIVGSEGKVFSFEPTPNTYNLLYKNTRELKNVVINNMAVWSKNSILKLFDFGLSYSGLNSFFKPRVSKKISQSLKPESISVPAISIDDYAKLYSVKPDFIKIDAESAEYDIIVGMTKTITDLKPIIVLEIGDVSEEFGKTKKCVKYLKNFGYKVLEYNAGIIQEHIIRDSYLGVYDNLLFLPLK